MKTWVLPTLRLLLGLRTGVGEVYMAEVVREITHFTVREDRSKP
jgi:hypothetical protein